MTKGTRQCSIDECARPLVARGWCAAHYQRWKKYGTPLSGPPMRKIRNAPPVPCTVNGCGASVVSRGWCNVHYRRWLHNGDPGETTLRAPGAGRHSYPPDQKLISLMASFGSYTKVATQVGVRRESLRDYLETRPELRSQMDSHRLPKLTPEDVRERGLVSGREYQRRYRQRDPELARQRRREHMAKYGPDYRHRWNHYNRLRRLTSVGVPDEESREYALILRGDPCCYCGARMEHIDHIHPIFLGGDGSWVNLTAACARCNLTKQARPLLLFMLDTFVR